MNRQICPIPTEKKQQFANAEVQSTRQSRQSAGRIPPPNAQFLKNFNKSGGGGLARFKLQDTRKARGNWKSLRETKGEFLETK
jgi:hypothetical protein